MAANAASGDLYIDNSGINLATDQIFEGSPVRIYANVKNRGSVDARGAVRFFLGDDSVQIGSDQPVAVLAGNSDTAFVDLYPPKGQHTIIVRIIPWTPGNDDPSNNIASRTIWVKADHDHDKIADEDDPDDDNDGVPDNEDAFPLDGAEQIDSDGDGQGDNADFDDDNDGTPDEDDALPFDPEETSDLDGDGIGDNADLDDDGDELIDTEEARMGLDPKLADTDGDGAIDGKDAFPLDPKESEDTDKDGIGNATDSDDDGDGLKDEDDPLPLNHGPVIDASISWLRVSNLSMTFDASKSWDTDGKIAKVEWDFGGDQKDGTKVKHVFQESGEQIVKLTVFDDRGEGRLRELRVKVIGMPVALTILVAVIGFGLAIIYGINYILPASSRKRGKIA